MSALTTELDVRTFFASCALTIPITASAAMLALIGGSLRGVSLRCAVRRRRGGVIARCDTGDGRIVVTSDSTAEAHFFSGETAPWPREELYYDVQADPTALNSQTVSRGRIEVLQRPTRARSTVPGTATGILSAELPLPTLVVAGRFESGGVISATPPLPTLSFAGTLSITGQVSATPPLPALSFAGSLQGSPPLDSMPAPAACFSVGVRLLTSYTGPLIRVRRGGTGGESDIGFNAQGKLDTAALNTFLAGVAGVVVTVYDQSGNGRHWTQAVQANQPILFTVGPGQVVIGTSPAMSNVGSALQLARPDAFGLSGATAVTIASVWTRDSAIGGSSMGPAVLGNTAVNGQSIAVYANASDTNLRIGIGGAARDFTSPSLTAGPNNTIIRMAAGVGVGSATCRRNGTNLTQSAVISGSNTLSLSNTSAVWGTNGGTNLGGRLGSLAVWASSISDSDCAIWDAFSTAEYGT
jgi:hypothetical protein